MFGWKLVSEAEIALRAQLSETRIASLAADLRAAKDYAAKCERLIEHERERIDAERDRADRIADSLFQSNGLPPTSETVVREQKTADSAHADKLADQMKQLMEIYDETENDLVEDGAEPLPEEFAETVK
jgi:hypothetical protein